MSKIAIDTNVLLYFLDTSIDERRTKAAELILLHPVFNSQSLSELINVLNRRWKFPKNSIMEVMSRLMKECQYVPITNQTIELGFELVKSMTFRFSMLSLLQRHWNQIVSSCIRKIYNMEWS